MVGALAAGRLFSPLDEELQLLPGQLTPHAHECGVRLATWVPFGRAAKLLAACLGVQVSEATLRRYTEAAGAACEAVHCATVDRIEREALPAGPGPETLLLSVDGAMVPLVHGEWAEVKTLAVGVVGEARQQGDEWVVHTSALSYFSRMTDAGSFQRESLAEIQRRGVENAGRVAAVMDGAEWEQRFVDFHCPQAIRILDFPHAAERLSQVGGAIWGEHNPTSQAWLEQRLHSLKHEGPRDVLVELRHLEAQHPDKTVIAENLAYLEKRVAHLDYGRFQAQGLPIGSGSVESANKVVVEARLKGAGKHWAPEHVNPMLALRNLVCNDRWAEGWPAITAQLRAQAAKHRLTLKDKRHGPPLKGSPHVALDRRDDDCTPKDRPAPPVSASSPSPGQPLNETEMPKQPYRPPANHPWRHSGIGRARFNPYHWGNQSKI